MDEIEEELSNSLASFRRSAPNEAQVAVAESTTDHQGVYVTGERRAHSDRKLSGFLVYSKSEHSLKELVFKAGFWSLLGYGVSMVIRFGSNLIMTRLLEPSYFGIMAIATIVMVGLAMISDLGLRQNIVQHHRGDDAVFLDSAWVVQVSRGFLVALIALTASLFIFILSRTGLVLANSVYENPLLPAVLAAVSFGAAIGGFTSTKWAEASRNLSFGKVTLIELAAQIVGLMCMLILALFLRNIWVLVIGGLTGTIARVLLSHVWLDGHANRWQWDREAVREIVKFGRWIFGSSILGFLASNGDRLILGGMIDAEVLGVYAVAFLMYGAFEQILVKVVSDVSFPALSKTVRERPENLSPNYYRLHSTIAAIAFAGAGALALCAPQLIQRLYDPRYAQAGWMLQILSISLLAVPYQIGVQCFVALGRPGLQFNITALRMLVLLLLTPIGFFLAQLKGALCGIVASQLAAAIATLLLTAKLGFFDWRKELRPWPALILGIGIGWLVNLGFRVVW
ncbi:O-antigen/teichoic acid export membrane protein [Bradyrhizobium sp. USDA 4463]